MAEETHGGDPAPSDVDDATGGRDASDAQ
jgi:hypothetical protein